MADLKDEQKEIDEEQAKISKRQADRKREEKGDAERMKVLEVRRKKVEKEEGKLLRSQPRGCWFISDSTRRLEVMEGTY